MTSHVNLQASPIPFLHITPCTLTGRHYSHTLSACACTPLCIYYCFTHTLICSMPLWWCKWLFLYLFVSFFRFLDYHSTGLHRCKWWCLCTGSTAVKLPFVKDLQAADHRASSHTSEWDWQKRPTMLTNSCEDVAAKLWLGVFPGVSDAMNHTTSTWQQTMMCHYHKNSSNPCKWVSTLENLWEVVQPCLQTFEKVYY